MRTCVAHLESLAPYFASRGHGTPKLDKESPDEYEQRTWRERLHTDENGYVILPPMGFKFAIDAVAKKLRMRVPGKGSSEYGKLLSGGVMVMEGVKLPVKKDEVEGQQLFLNADGRRGGGTRVMRRMPFVPKWSGPMTFYILDNAIPKDVFEKHLTEAGVLIGIGQHRPENGGYRGRFKVNKFEWSE